MDKPSKDVLPALRFDAEFFGLQALVEQCDELQSQIDYRGDGPIVEGLSDIACQMQNSLEEQTSKLDAQLTRAYQLACLIWKHGGGSAPDAHLVPSEARSRRLGQDSPRFAMGMDHADRAAFFAAGARAAAGRSDAA